MKGHGLKFFILIVSLLGCTGCFDLQENVFLNKDGSGKFSFVVNLSEFKMMADMFDESEETKGDFTLKNSSTGKLNSSFVSTIKKLEKTKGISDIKTIEDTVNYTFGLSFNFKDVYALNKAMNRLFEDDSITSNTTETTFFVIKNKQFIRLDVLDSKSIFGKTTSMSNTNTKKTENSFFSASKLFETISYTSNYEFEQTIDSINNNSAILSNNLKKVSLKCYPFADTKKNAQNKCTIANIITLK